jgi:hypothetical protein
MALNYQDSAALMTDGSFRGRVKVACLHWAAYVMAEATTTASHNARYRYAMTIYQSPDTVAGQVQPPTVQDSNVQAAGAQVDDATLQAAVEKVINDLL